MIEAKQEDTSARYRDRNKTTLIAVIAIITAISASLVLALATPNYASANAVLAKSANIYGQEYYALPGETINIQLAIHATEDTIGAMHLRIDYDPSVCLITNCEQEGFDAFVANTEHADEGWIEFIAYQTGADGVTNAVINLSTEAVGDYGDTTVLNLTVISMYTNNGSIMDYNIKDAFFRCALKGDFSGDMFVNAWDCTYLARYLVNISGYNTIYSGEVSGDGTLDAYDVTYLARKIVGLI